MAEVSDGLSGTRQCWLFLGLVVILMIVGVIYPAVWSGKRTCRTAASSARPDPAVEVLTSAGPEPVPGWLDAGRHLPACPCPSPGTA